MIVTKEHQEAMVEKYVKDKHTTDECTGFIDGLNAMLELIVKNNVVLHDVRQRLLDEIEDINYNSVGNGCGLEDRGIQDRYQAMEYGWEQAIEACKETIENVA